MRFVNTTGNTHNLDDVGITIPFIGPRDQSLDSNIVRKSNRFQSLVLSGHFEITFAENNRMEQNLLKLQNNQVQFENHSNEIKVLFRGHFGGNTGYAKANRNLLFGLSKSGIDVSISLMSDIKNSPDRSLLERFNKLPSSKTILLHSTVPSFSEQIDANYRILCTTTETSTVPSQFIESCEMYDEVWTVSDFCKQAFINCGLKKPILVIPNGVDSSVYNEKVKPIEIKPSLKKFVFVSVMSWNYRKGYDVLLKAYFKAFSGNDDVSLLLVVPYQLNDKGNRCFTVDKSIKQFIALHGGQSPAHISRHGGSITELDMPRLYRSCNAFVLPTRGEGWGLPFCEASLCGLPVIGTNYSGQTMFMKHDNSTLIEIDQLGKPQTQVHYWDSQTMPILGCEVVDDLSQKMRYVYSHYEKCKLKNAKLQELILNQFTYEQVGELAKRRLEKIWNKL